MDPARFSEAESRLRELPEIELLGVLRRSSNYTFLARLGPTPELLAVYKPAAGESPLWDFPTGTLYRREMASYLLARELGWPRIPPTVIRESAPHGVGALQLFIETEVDRHYLNSPDVPEATWQEVALFDVIGKQRGVPVSELLGGRVRDRIRLYGSAGMYMPPEGYALEAHAIADITDHQNSRAFGHLVGMQRAESDSHRSFHAGAIDEMRLHRPRCGLLQFFVWREECADLSAIFVEPFIFGAGHIVERTMRPNIAQFQTPLHVHRVAFDDGEERLFAVEVVRTCKQQLQQIEVLILQGVNKLVRKERVVRCLFAVRVGEQEDLFVER